MKMKTTKNNAPDTSRIVEQRDKVAFDFDVKEFPWTDKQKEFIKIAMDKNTRVVICRAPAGVGKTVLSLFCSLLKLKQKKVSEIVYIRAPIESASKSVGFLAGSYEDKMSPYGLPLDDHLKELLLPSIHQKLLKDQRIKVDSVGFIKGRTYNVASIIADEAEDLDPSETSLLLTRLGHYSTLFLIGDSNQTNVKNSGFNKVFDLFNDDISKQNGVFTFEFDSSDCMRSPITKFILQKFEELNKK